MASLQGVEVLHRYDYEVSLLDIGDTLSKTCDLLIKLDGQIKAAANKTEAVKSPYDLKAERDKVAAKEAHEFIQSIIAKIAEFVDAKPSRAFHLATESKLFSQFVTEEVRYARRRSERDLPVDKRSDSEAIKRSDAKILIDFAKQLWSMAPALVDDIKSGELTLPVEIKEGLLVLPKVRESASNGQGNPTQGRWVGLYNLQWTVDGETFPIGTDPVTVQRAIFTGVERVGKKVSDFWGPFDKQGGAQAVKPGQSMTAVVNGKTVTATKIDEPDAS